MSVGTRSTTAIAPAQTEPSGLSFWMERVLVEAEHAGLSLAPDPIHDLRVALRRCRSMAVGYMAIDPDKDWTAMTRAARRLFRRLGEMRDAQVMEEWVRRLGSPDDPVSGAVLVHLEQIRPELENGVVAAIQEFDRQKWTRWARRLKVRSRRIPVAGAVFQLSALGAWEGAYALHKAALRNRSAVSWHRLRIGLKKFRYLVENFLPLQHEEWKNDLKQLQDCLGEFHDLIVFWNLAERIKAFPDEGSRDRWRQILESEKAARVKTYREKMLGDSALWRLWREGLPSQNRLHSLGLAVLQRWASLRGADLGRVRNVRRLALQLYDGLHPGRRSDPFSKSRRVALHAAVILRQIGGIKKSMADAGKSAGELLERLPPLPGFSSDLLRLAVIAAQCSRVKLQDLGEDTLDGIKDEERGDLGKIVGILRLAATLAENSDPPFRRLSVEPRGDCITIHVQDYSEFGALAEKVARSRYLLEYSCQRPVLIRSLSADDSPAQP